MTPVEPALHDGAHRVLFAKDQPPYLPLPASVDDQGLVMTEWEPTEEDLDRLLSGGRVRLWLHHALREEHCPRCGRMETKRLTPISIEAIEPACGFRES